MKKTITALLLAVSLLLMPSCIGKNNEGTHSSNNSSAQDTSQQETKPLSPKEIADEVNNTFVRKVNSAKSFKVVTDATDESRIDEIGYVYTVTSHSEYTVSGKGSENEHSLSLFSVNMSGSVTDYSTYLGEGMYYISDGEDSLKIPEAEIDGTPLEQYILKGPVLVPKKDLEESIFEGNAGFISEQENLSYIEFSLKSETAEELYSNMLAAYKTEAGARTLEITSAKVKISTDNSLGTVSFESTIEMVMTADQGNEVLTYKIVNTSKSVYSEINSESVSPTAPEGIANYPLYQDN